MGWNYSNQVLTDKYIKLCQSSEPFITTMTASLSRGEIDKMISSYLQQIHQYAFSNLKSAVDSEIENGETFSKDLLTKCIVNLENEAIQGSFLDLGIEPEIAIVYFVNATYPYFCSKGYAEK